MSDRKRSVGGLVLAAVILLVVASCAGSRGASPGGTGGSASGPPSSATSTAPNTPTKFGTLPSPCGAGNAKGSTDQGVSDSSIRIAYGDDSGFPQNPGLDRELGDAMKAMIKWCNDQGGILGRKIVGDFYDAAVTQVNSVMQQACKSDFMLVGEGWSLDGSAEQTRLGCNLVAVPGFGVDPNFANAPEMYGPVPNPDDYIDAAQYYLMAKLFPNEVKKAAILHTTLAATETASAKAQEGMKAAGFHILDCGVKINYTGEPDYKPFAQKLKNCGVKLLFTNGSPGAVLFNYFQAMDQVGFHPIILSESNLYSTTTAKWNTAGIGNRIYSRMAFQPLENADQVPAVKAYIDAVKATGGDVAELGEEATSAFLLWATEAKACGSNLTRQCMVDHLSKVHNWTGGGLHAPTDPARNLPPKCSMLVKLTGTAWAQWYPKAKTKLECSDKYLFHVSKANWGTSLDKNRLATQFLNPNLIEPKS